MQFIKIALKIFLAFLYGIGVEFRNFLYDFKFIKSYKSKIYTIVIGNITVGGTGKSPFIRFLIRNLQNQYKIAVISRGFGRKTKSLQAVNSNSKLEEIGDEIFDLFSEINEGIIIICSNDRVEGIKFIEKNYPEINLILLDDGFQHRNLLPHFSIILESYYQPTNNDCLLPLGKLREPTFRAKRADLQIQTKVPSLNFTENDKFDFKTTQKYNFEKSGFQVILVSGLADNQQFMIEMKKYFFIEKYFFFNDHQFYLPNEIENILSHNSFPILTTTKDWVKIKEIITPIHFKRFIVVELEIEFLKEKELFLEKLTTKINQHLASSMKNN